MTVCGLGSAPVERRRKPGAAVGVPVYRAALEAGINYVDTAHYYDDAETYLGELMPEWRDRIVLATEDPRQDASTAAEQANFARQFEQSLRLLRTDHVDVLHLHSVGGYKLPPTCSRRAARSTRCPDEGRGQDALRRHHR